MGFRHAPPFPKRFIPPTMQERSISCRRWRTLRARHLRAHPMCSVCGGIGLEVHHIVPREVAPERTFDPENLATMCRECHRKHHEYAKK